jgi:Zn-dependent protease with chaperone function
VKLTHDTAVEARRGSQAALARCRGVASSLRLPGIRPSALFAATVLTELPVIWVRMLLVLAGAALVLLLKGDSTGGAEGLVKLALIPTGWSLLALLTPAGGGWWWRQKMGGREPSLRERAAYQDAVETIRSLTPAPIRLPTSWFVIDAPQPDAAVCGEWLVLSRGLLESEWLAAVLAHELGHVNSSDGKLTAAINRLVINPPARKDYSDHGRTVVLAADAVSLSISLIGGLAWLIRKAIRFAGGGVALRLLAPFWGSYWREREYAADQYAARLGQGEELADFLELHALIHDHPVPFIWLTEHTHPPTELRIDRLRNASSRPVAVAPGSEPVKTAPAGPPAAGPDGPALTEPDPCAESSLRSAGMALPTSAGHIP